MNKFLTVAAVATVALVKGEADADAFYGAYGYGALPYAGYGYSAAYPYSYGYPYAYGAYPYAHHAYAPVAAATAQVSPSSSLTTLGLADASIPSVAGGYAGAGRYVANSAGVVHVAKREAEADAEADPALFYSAYGYAGYPYAAGYSAYSAGYPYSYGYPYAYSSYAHVAAPAVATTVEAEAAPAVAAVAAPAVGYPYAYGAYPYAAYAAPAPVATGYAQVSPSSSLTTLGLADASIPAVAGGYAGAGRYVANSAGVVHVAKREAEADAEADPALLYSSAYPYSYGYAGYPYAAGYSAGYPYSYGYPYAYGAYPYAHAYAAPVATGYAQVSPSASLTTLGLADASIPALAGGYAGAGRYVANSAGVVHVA